MTNICIPLTDTREFTILNSEKFFFKEWVPNGFSIATLTGPAMALYYGHNNWDYLSIFALILTLSISITLFNIEHYIIIERENNLIESYWIMFNKKFRYKKYKLSQKAIFNIREIDYDDSNKTGLLLELFNFNRVIRLVDTDNDKAVKKLIDFWEANNYFVKIECKFALRRLKID